jgi:hypothetical protein
MVETVAMVLRVFNQVQVVVMVDTVAVAVMQLLLIK